MPQGAGWRWLRRALLVILCLAACALWLVAMQVLVSLLVEAPVPLVGRGPALPPGFELSIIDRQEVGVVLQEFL